jgi:hypothetical protein
MIIFAGIASARHKGRIFSLPSSELGHEKYGDARDFSRTDFAIGVSELVASKRKSAAAVAAPFSSPFFGVPTMLEQMQIASGFVPVNLATAANNSDWVNLKSYTRLLILFFKGAAASGTEDPTVTVLQATDVAGTGSKALNISRSWTKTDADLTTIGQFTAGAPSTNTLTVASSAQKSALWLIEVLAADLDKNSGFSCVQANVADVGSVSQLGCLLYVLGEPRQSDTPALNPSALA